MDWAGNIVRLLQQGRSTFRNWLEQAVEGVGQHKEHRGLIARDEGKREDLDGQSMDCEGHQRWPDVEVLEHWEGCWRVEDELYLGLVDQIFIFYFENIEKVGLR